MGREEEDRVSTFDLGPALTARARRERVIGTFVIELPTIATIRAVVGAGFDFVVIDTEHSTFGFDIVETLVLAAQSLGVAALVRVWGADTGLIGRALEAGANGLLLPHVDNLERARQIVSETRFPPLGQRGFSPLLRYDVVGQSKPRISDSTLVIAQIEGKAGLAAAPDIAALPGIDGVFIGTHDLSLSLGVAVDDPAIIRAAADLAHRLAPSAIRGVYLDQPESSAGWAELSYRVQCVSFDGRMLARATAETVRLARASGGGP